MDGGRFAELRLLVDRALELPPQDRDAFLLSRCADDAELLGRARSLLAHDEGADRLTGAVEDRVRAAAAEALDDYIGPATIGNYRVVEKIGEGGMGVVYRAEQTGALRRSVALKLIRAGWNSQRVVARFESERLALARMDHPNIARVFDAGSTSDGRPWFVMELVEGRHLVAWCDHHRLPPDRRLALFLEVCRGVQHAHRKGIIHRDLKPSNILVSGQPGNPALRIIDFGIAKALTGADDGAAGMTVAGQKPGSPDYMSPERLEGDVDDPDVRSDVYSLGVILFELLSGRLPFDRTSSERRASGSDPDRGTRADPPSMASRSLRTRAGTREIAAARGTDPSSLRRALRGELDWIVARCLAPDRDQRYDSVRELARDIERHLAGEPVEAGQPGIFYRLGKSVRRHRAPIGVTLLVLAALTGGLVESLRQKRGADDARREAEAVTAFLSGMLASVQPEQKGRDVTVRRVLDEAAGRMGTEFADRPLVRARLQSTIGRTYLALGENDEAIRLQEEVLALRRRIQGEEAVETLMAMCDLGSAVSRAGDSARAAELYRAALAGLEDRSDGDVERVLKAVIGLANALADQGRLEESEPYYLDGLAECRERLGPDDPLTASFLSNLALLRADQGDMAQAADILAEVLEIRRRALGEDHPETMESVLNLAGARSQLGDLDAAVAALEPLLPRARRALGDEHRITLTAMNNLAWAYARIGRLDEAETLTRRCWETRRRVLGDDHFETMISAHNMADVLFRRGRLDEAEALHRENLARRIRVLGEDHPHVRISREALAEVLAAEAREKTAAGPGSGTGGGAAVK